MTRIYKLIRHKFHNPLVSIFSYCKTTNSEKLSKANDKPCSTHQVVTISAQMKNSLAFTYCTFLNSCSFFACSEFTLRDPNV